MRVEEQPIKVLDDGFLHLVEIMGSDESIEESARVSYGAGTRKRSDTRTLLRYLMRHRHSTPFEMAEMRFLVRVPMDVWRQWIRHRTASVNEYSTRYSEAIDSASRTTGWRLQSEANKQGSREGRLQWPEGWEPHVEEQPEDYLSRRERLFLIGARDIYEERLKFGIAREQARKDLPLSTYTEAYWKCDIRNILHFLSLRLDPHAQQEIREYATAMSGLVKKYFPLTYEAFEDYVLNSVTFSGPEIQVLSGMSRIDILSKREQDEFRAKYLAVYGVPYKR